MRRSTIIPVLHAVIFLIEVIALIHDIQVFGIGMFQYYTIDSNILQMLVSAGFLVCFIGKKDVPAALGTLHLVGAVSLTITFLIAAFVLAPQEGFAYYFLFWDRFCQSRHSCFRCRKIRFGKAACLHR